MSAPRSSTTLELVPTGATNSHQLIQQAFQGAVNAPVPAKLKPVLPWFEADVFLNETTKLQQLVAPLGLGTGFAGAYSGYILGKGLGTIISATFKANTYGQSFLEIYFGTVAYTPIAILIGLPTKARFQYYVGLLQGRPELPTADDRPYTRFGAGFLSNFLSLFAGLPFIALQYDELKPLTAIDYIVPVCAVIASYCAVIYAENTLKDSLLNHFETPTPELVTARTNLYARLDSTIESITTMSNNDIDRLFKLLIQKSRPDDAENATQHKLKELFATSRIVPRGTTETSQTTSYKVRRAIRDFLGYSIGGASTYVLYGLAVQTSDSAYENAVMGTCAGILAMSTNLVFTAMLAQRRAAQLYTPDANDNLKPTMLSSVNQGLALCAAAPSTYLAIVGATNTFLTVVAVLTFLGGGLAKKPGFDYLASEAVDFFENLFRYDTPDVQRKNLKKMLLKIKNAIPNMHPDQVIALEKALAEAIPAPTDNHEVSIRIDRFPAEDKQDPPSTSCVVFHTGAMFPTSPRQNTSIATTSGEPDANSPSLLQYGS
jgi:hypothetical protein